MNYDYNTQRKKLVLPEYGRNIQKMVNHIKTIDDRKERTKAARTTIQVMQNMIPHGRDLEEFQHKLWDHITVIADFDLDIDSPFEPPTPESLNIKPKRVPYNTNTIKFKHYGRGIELLVEKAIEMTDGEEKDRLVKLIANHMKRSYLTWNRNQVTDEAIFADLETLSGGKLKVGNDLTLTDTREILARSRKKKMQQRKK